MNDDMLPVDDQLPAPPTGEDDGMDAPPPEDPAAAAPPAEAPAPAKPSRGSRGSLAPVGDIQVKKKAKTYNTYTLQLSMGQIEAIHSALGKDHANPIADELLALFGYYLKNVPGPGEEEEDLKAQDEMSAVGGGAGGGDMGGEGEEEDDGLPIPMPPGYKGDGRTTVAGEGPEDPSAGEGDMGGGPPPNSLPGGADDGGGGDDADQMLAAPPRE